MITIEDINAMSDIKPPFNQTDQEAAKHNWPSPQDSYAHTACGNCNAGFFGPKRAHVCHYCYQRITAPVPELQDLQFKSAPDGSNVYEPTMKLTDKFVTPEPLPTPFERELLTIMIEECGEVIQRATKMLRFGVMEVQEGQNLTNRARLSDETGDLYAMLERCLEHDLLEGERMAKAMTKKNQNLKKYMQTTKDTPA